MNEREMKPFDGKPEKGTYQEKIEAQLKEWGVKIGELKAKVEKSKTEVKKKYEKQVEDLRIKQEALEKKLKEFKESSEEAWDHLKTGIEKSLDELKESVDRSIPKFKEIGEEVAETALKKKKAYVQKIESQLREWGY